MNARKNHHLFPRWLFSSVVSVAECSSSSFASALNDEESSSKRLEPSSSKNNIDTKTKKNLPAKVDELNAIHAKQALRELSLRQISQNYQPTHEENKTVRDFVYSSVSRVLFAFSITGVFGFASVDVKSLKMGTSGKSTFKNARNVFRARVMIGLATGVLGGMFEHRSVQFYKNLCVKILDVKEGESKMPGELAQILRDLDPLGEFVKDQERKRNRERLSGFRDGRERMTKTTRTTTTAATVAARGAPSFKRDEEEDKEEEKQHHHHQRRERTLRLSKTNLSVLLLRRFRKSHQRRRRRRRRQRRRPIVFVVLVEAFPIPRIRRIRGRQRRRRRRAKKTEPTPARRKRRKREEKKNQKNTQTKKRQTPPERI